MKVYAFLDVYGKTKRRKAIVRNNRNYLLDNMQPKGELIASLLSLSCITEEECHFIQRQRSTRYRNERLLHIMESLDDTNFSKFFKCLRQTNQTTVTKIIENGGGLKYKLTIETAGLYHIYQNVFRKLLELIFSVIS